MKSMSADEIRALILFAFIGLFILGVIKLMMRAKQKYKKTVFFVLGLFVVVFVIGFRFIDRDGWGGQDAFTYVKLFLNIKTDYGNNNTTEPLFLAYLYLLRIVTENERIFIVITTVVITYSFLIYAKKYYIGGKYVITLSLLWPIFLYYSCSAIRNGLAIALSQIAFIFLTDKKYVKAGILTIVSLLFHYSAIVVFAFELFYFVCKWLQKKGSWIWFTLAMSVAVAIFLIPIAEMFFSSSRYVFLEGRSSSSFLGLLPYYLIGFLALLNHKKLIDRTEEEDSVLIELDDADLLTMKDKDEVSVFCTYFLCIIYPICVRFGLYRLPYFFIAPLCVTAKNVCLLYRTNPRFIYKALIILFFSVYMILKTITIGEQSKILMYHMSLFR